MTHLATLDRIPNPVHRLFHPRFGRPSERMPTLGRTNALRDESFLIAFLPYAISQAKRHDQSVSVLLVATDRLDAIRDLHGPDFAEAAVRLVGETVLKTLRASDVVARLDDGRIVAVLPFAGVLDLPMIAEAVRKAIAEAGRATCAMPRLTASIGLASYPDHAQDAGSLLVASAEALDRARSLGTNRTAEAEPESASVPE